MESLFETFQHSGKRSEVLNNHTLDPGVLQRARRPPSGEGIASGTTGLSPSGLSCPTGQCYLPEPLHQEEVALGVLDSREEKSMTVG